MNFAGIDIGGANVKFVCLENFEREIAFPIWRDKHQLPDLLDELAAMLPPKTLLGVTMTAELADCFTTKQDGVQFIASAVSKSFSACEPLFYRTDGRMCGADEAKRDWRAIAASNWHATAWMAFVDSSQDSGFVIDIGSTTTDIIPVENGQPVIALQDDRQRLTNGQLLYAGLGRTPICSLLTQVQLSVGNTSIAREFFATIKDALIWLEKIPAEHDSTSTADGRPGDKHHAGARLAKMVCADLDDLDPEDIDAIAKQSQQAFELLFITSLRQVLASHTELPNHFKTFGLGAPFISEMVRRSLTDRHFETATISQFSDDATVNQTAPARAVAMKRQQVFDSMQASNG